MKVAGAEGTVQENQYDARNFRIVRKDYANGTLSQTRHCYFTNGWQNVEERLGTSTNPDQQNVWGIRYIDDLVLRDRDTTGGGTLDERLYACQDANWNVTAIVGTDGAVKERYEYDPYGNITFLTSDFNIRSASNYAWETLYCGYRWDVAIKMFAVRHRYYHPLLGNWIMRDPLGYVAGVSLYRAYFVLRSNDPYGLQQLDGPITIPSIPSFDAPPLPPIQIPSGTEFAQVLNLCETVVASLSNPNHAVNQTEAGSLSRKCNVNIFCGNCGRGGKSTLGAQTFISGGRVNICVNKDVQWTNPHDISKSQADIIQLEALVLHEMVHAQQYLAETPGLCQDECFKGKNPKPGNLTTPRGLTPQQLDDACTKCKQRETQAYQVQAAYVFPMDAAKQADFLAAGLCFSCAHVCQEYQGKNCPPFPT